LLRLRLHVHLLLDQTLAVRAGMLLALQSRSRVVLGVQDTDRRMQGEVQCLRQALLFGLRLLPAMTERHTPPAVNRLIAGLLLSPTALDRLGYLIDVAVDSETRRHGGAPSQSLALQAAINAARCESRKLSRLSRDDSESDHDVPPSETVMGSAEAAVILGVSRRTVQRHATELGGRRRGRTWRLDRATVEAAARGTEGEDG
jgi:excisionase family DNA binding protein